MIGLVFLVPQHAPFGLAVALFVLGAPRAAGVVRLAKREGPPANKYKRLTRTLREYGLPLVASLGLVLVAIEILRGDTGSIFALVAVVAALLTTASWNAWLLLIEEEPSGL